MKKSFKEILEKSDPDMIGYAVDSIKDDRISEDTLARIRNRVTGSAVGNDKSSDPAKNTSNQKRSNPKKWIPILSAAACLVIVVGVVLGVGILNRKSPAPFIPSDDKTAYGEIKLSVSKESNPVVIRDIVSRGEISSTSSTEYGFYVDKSGSTCNVTVTKDGIKQTNISDGASFTEIRF